MRRAIADSVHGWAVAVVIAGAFALVQTSAIADDKCDGLKDAVESEGVSTVNWAAAYNQADRRLRDLQEPLRKAYEEVLRLDCLPEREPGNMACKAALARYNELSSQVRFATANLDGVRRGFNASNLRYEKAARAYRECLEGVLSAADDARKPPDKPPADKPPPEKPAADKPPPDKPAADKPPSPSKPPEPPPPSIPPTSTEAFKPRVLPPGRYQAALWTALSGQLVELFRKDAGKVPHPLPAILTVDANGGVTGTGRWELTPAETDRSTLKPKERLTNEVTFRLQGKIDWSGGAIVLRLTDGRQVFSRVDEGGDTGYVHTTEFEYDLSGWQVGHPSLEKPLSGLIDQGKASGFDPTPNPELYGLPHFVAVGGLRRYRDLGWVGAPDYGKPGDIKTSPGGGARVTVKKDLYQYRSRWHGPKDDDRTASLKAAWESGHYHWYLKVIGPAPLESAPQAQPADTGGLVAFGLSPRNQIYVRAGQAFALDAIGVYIDRPDERVNLNDVVSWDIGVGLTRLKTGELRALGPGRYKVTATLVRDGTTYSDTTEIIVEP